MIRRLGTTAFILLFVYPAAARAQSNVEVNAGIQFDFLNPGARSLALGSAFTAIADDATTAFTNPAGLWQLTKREVSFEGRIRQFEAPYTVRGRASGTVTRLGVDTIDGLVDGTSDDTIGGASFVSFVYPSSRWAVAAYRHEVVRFKSNITTEGAFLDDEFRALPVKGSLDLKIVDYGVSGSFTVTPQVSVGAGLVIYDFSEESTTTRFDVPGTVPAFYSAPNYSNDNRFNIQTQNGSGTKLGVNVGVAVKPNDKVQVGAVYRRGTKFDVEIRNTGATTGTVFFAETGQFHIPDVFSFGVMGRISEPLRVAVDVTHIRYSQLTRGFVDIFKEPTDESALYSISDGTEIHGGAEYLLPTGMPVFLRGGFWYDPSHSLQYAGSEITFKTIFRDRDDAQMHYTGGAGFVVNQFELNVAVDIAKTIKTTSFSTVVRF